MGNVPGGNAGQQQQQQQKRQMPKKPMIQPQTGGRRKQKSRGVQLGVKLPVLVPTMKCKLRLMRGERLKDWLLLEEEYVSMMVDRAEKLKQQDEQQSETPTPETTSTTTTSTSISLESNPSIQQLRGNPLMLGTLEEIIDDNHAIVSTINGPEFFVSILSIVDKDQLELNCTVLLHNKTLAIVGVLIDDQDPLISTTLVSTRPTESFKDIGGLDTAIQELKEAVELPLTHPELYTQLGIKPPKGVILYGPPGTGKTLLAKAVANSTSASFYRIVGSELIQKYLGEGPKLVRELFKAAASTSPSIVFIDEIDSIGSKRYDTTSGGEREIQRVMLELLNQLDGFQTEEQVKVIMATNKIESLDPALLRPGRLDRKIEIKLPDIDTRKKILAIQMQKMNITTSMDEILNEIVIGKEDLSGADLKAICTEAGLLALRERRMRVSLQDFKEAKTKTLGKKGIPVPEGMYV
jgi:26S proteasome regulatory subunit T2